MDVGEKVAAPKSIITARRGEGGAVGGNHRYPKELDFIEETPGTKIWNPPVDVEKRDIEKEVHPDQIT